MEYQNFKNLPPTKFNFHEILSTNFFKYLNFFIICFVKHGMRKCSQLKEKIGAKHIESLVLYILVVKKKSFSPFI